MTAFHIGTRQTRFPGGTSTLNVLQFSARKLGIEIMEICDRADFVFGSVTLGLKPGVTNISPILGEELHFHQNQGRLYPQTQRKVRWES